MTTFDAHIPELAETALGKPSTSAIEKKKADARIKFGGRSERQGNRGEEGLLGDDERDESEKSPSAETA